MPNRTPAEVERDENLARLADQTEALSRSARRLEEISDPEQWKAEAAEVARQQTKAILAAAKVSADAAEDARRSEDARHRLRVGTAGAVLVVLAVLLMGWFAAHQAIEGTRRDVTHCFLSPGRNDPGVVAACGRKFPGYEDLQRRSAKATAQFQDLLAEIPRNRDRIAELERRVSELEGR